MTDRPSPYSLPEWSMWVRAIRANPEDDDPRLQCADWLDEHAGTVPCDWCRGTGEDRPPEPVKTPDGRTFVYTGPLGPCPKCKGSRYQSDGVAERAEFVRLQVELARIPEVPKGERFERVRGLADRGHSDYLWRLGFQSFVRSDIYPSATSVPRALYVRGFVESVTCAAALWLAHGDTLYAREPVVRVELTTPLNAQFGPIRRWSEDGPFGVTTHKATWLAACEGPGVPCGQTVTLGPNRSPEERAHVFARFEKRIAAARTDKGYAELRWPGVEFTLSGYEQPSVDYEPISAYLRRQRERMGAGRSRLRGF